MALALVVGPAHAGKVALLLERYLAALDADAGHDPWLVVPNRIDVERVERDLLRRRPALLAGRIGTFDDLFEHIVREDPLRRPVASDTQRALAIRKAIARTSLSGLSNSSSSDGFADSLLATLGEVESALVAPGRLGGDLGRLAEAYREELDRLGFWDRDGLRGRAVERLASEFGSWSGEPVFAYGFEDLTGAEWALLEALSARADVTVSIPYEPGRAAFASLERTVEDLAGLAGGSIEELGPSREQLDGRFPAPLAHLERELFADKPVPSASLDGAIGFLEGAGARGTTELVAAEVLELLRSGTPAERIGVVCDSVDRWRAVLETVLVPLGIPFAIEQPGRLGETALGRALLGLLRFAWLEGRRGDLFRYLRSPFSGLERRSVDYVEGRLRGRAIAEPGRVAEETERLRGAPLPALDRLRDAVEPTSAVRELTRAMARSAWGLEAPPTTYAARSDARAYQAVARTLDELETFARREGAPLGPDAVIAALERTTVRPVAAGEVGHVAVLDYRRARTREFDVVILLGLEEGSLPASRPALAVPRRRRTPRSGRAPRTRRLGRPRPLPLLHGVHACEPKARARSRGRDRRRSATRAEPVLG